MPESPFQLTTTPGDKSHRAGQGEAWEGADDYGPQTTLVTSNKVYAQLHSQKRRVNEKALVEV